MDETQLPEDTPAFHLEVIKLLLETIVELLDKYKIRYFIDGGTLLGAVRGGDIIPYDTDADIGIFESDFEKLWQLDNELESTMICSSTGIPYQIRIQKLEGITKIYVVGLWLKRPDRIIPTPSVDLYSWTFWNKDKILLTNTDLWQQYPSCRYYQSEMFPLKTYQFGHLKLTGPFNPMPYLTRYYGEDCVEVKRYKPTDYSHVLEIHERDSLYKSIDPESLRRLGDTETEDWVDLSGSCEGSS